MTSNTGTRRLHSFKRYCSAYGCLNKSKINDESKLSFFKIPEDFERRQEWLTVIDRNDLLDKKSNKNYVCSAHFDDSAMITYISKRLKSPKFLIPHPSIR